MTISIECVSIGDQLLLYSRRKTAGVLKKQNSGVWSFENETFGIVRTFIGRGLHFSKQVKNSFHKIAIVIIHIYYKYFMILSMKFVETFRRTKQNNFLLPLGATDQHLKGGSGELSPTEGIGR